MITKFGDGQEELKVDVYPTKIMIIEDDNYQMDFVKETFENFLTTYCSKYSKDEPIHFEVSTFIQGYDALKAIK